MSLYSSARTWRAVPSQRPVTLSRPLWLAWELILWSIVLYVYLIALAVVSNWLLAEYQVKQTLQDNPALSANLAEYAQIGRDWQLFSSAAAMLKPLADNADPPEGSELLSTALQSVQRRIPTVKLLSSAAQAALPVIVQVGEELESLSRLEEVVLATQQFTMEPNRTTLRALAPHYDNATIILNQVAHDLRELAGTTGGTSDLFDAALQVIADGVSNLGLSALIDPAAVTAVGGPARMFAQGAYMYQERVAKDAATVTKIRDTLVRAEQGERVVTYFLLQDFIQWFTENVWGINGVILLLAPLRLYMHRRGWAYPPGHQVSRARP
ncbi:MAG: hypothetical protein H3C34_25680 [Caldilineaceae bacterium]|nr:hypothetical protein [Caldilineaceae bacterium]